MTNKTETLWKNYEATQKLKGIEQYPLVTKEKFFEIHREFPKEAYPLPSELASKLCREYKELHNHFENLDPLKSKCLICNPKETHQKGKKKG